MSENIKIHETKKPDGPHCGACIFFKPLTKDDLGNGECHFNPPTAVPLVQQGKLAGSQPQLQFLTFFPQLAGSQWCGQFIGIPDVVIPDVVALDENPQ